MMHVRLPSLLCLSLGALCLLNTAPGAEGQPEKGDKSNLPRSGPEGASHKLDLSPFSGQLDAPLLFVKRHSYSGIHIYDTYYKWPPGGGGIYVLENPAAPRSQWKIRPVIDPTTPDTLGLGVYTHPELSYDAKRLLFCFKGEPAGSTSIYEIGIDGRGLRRLTDPTPTCDCYKGSHGGQHDLAPAYLPDGRIVFLSTRPSGLVPCANEGVSILHVMNADGSDIHPISVNNVNEFDPSVLPDGRVLFGRWEYVDKNALTIQSLWTVNPDGTQETALFANNAVFPEAILDARAVPGSHLVVGTFAKHNSTPRGSIALVDPRLGKNGPRPCVNLEHPDQPEFDRGDSCEPWPVSADVFLFSGRPPGAKRNAIEMIDRAGHRAVVLSDPDICLHAPMLVKPRPREQIVADSVDRQARTGRFFLQDVYRGLVGVKPGEVKWLRVIEETSRVSPTPGGRNPYNQTFLISSALAFSAKNFLGIVPVEEDGSAYFEVPSGRAVYLQALDADGRLIQSMRTFVQAAPGTTRSCIGCHEHKYSTAANAASLREVMDRAPRQLEPESWGTGYLDYPGMVQPVLDKHCVRCHGGPEGIAAGMDLSGGWTEHFNISYENLTSRRETQLVAYWIAGIDCMNGTAFWSSQLFAPRKHGSGAAPLAALLASGHDGQLPNLTRPERDLLMAWIDSNGMYHGTWDYTQHGCAIREWGNIRQALVDRMQQAGCLACHGDGPRVGVFESDWINLKDPEMSRILRAPLGAGADGFGLGLCRQRKVDPTRQRIRLLWRGYAHAVQPLDAFAPKPFTPSDAKGEPVVSFTSTADPHYQAMLSILREGRQKALAAPRVDMPGAEVIAGACRQFLPPPLPDPPPALQAAPDKEAIVRLAWECSARTIGLEAELHRSDQPGFAPTQDTLLARTTRFEHSDTSAPPGQQHYALVLVSGEARAKPVYADVTVPPPPAPPAPAGLKAVPASHSVRLRWNAPPGRLLGYHVYRAKAEKGDKSNLPRSGPTTLRAVPGASHKLDLSPFSGRFEKITPEPVPETFYTDGTVEVEVPYTYAVRAVSRRGVESQPTAPATASAVVVKEPVFAATFDGQARATRSGAQAEPGRLHGGARAPGGILDLAQGGYATFPHGPEFDLTQPISVECWIRFEQPGRIPVVLSCGLWNQAGWFLQSIGGRWRWHVGGIDCDGGKVVMGQWVHVVGTFDGRTARLFQDGRQVAEKAGQANTAPRNDALHVGQYSAQPAADFQVHGRLTGVKIYHRPLTAPEAAAAAKTKPP